MGKIVSFNHRRNSSKGDENGIMRTMVTRKPEADCYANVNLAAIKNNIMQDEGFSFCFLSAVFDLALDDLIKRHEEGLKPLPMSLIGLYNEMEAYFSNRRTASKTMIMKKRMEDHIYYSIKMYLHLKDLLGLKRAVDLFTLAYAKTRDKRPEMLNQRQINLHC